MRTFLSSALALLLMGLGSHARAEMIYTAPPDLVATHAELVVQARVHLETRRATIVRALRGEVAGTIEILNLRDYASQGTVGDAPPPSSEAILFLDELDGRYYLVHTSSPAWIRPHASILYLPRDGKVLEYGQILSGVLQLMERKGATRETLDTELGAWLKAPRAKRIERPSLPASEAARLYAILDPFVDLHRREVVSEPHLQQLRKVLDGLETLVVDTTGELQRRSIEALLVLAQQWGPDQNRCGVTEARLVELLDRLGQDPFVEPCLDEIRSEAVSASRRAAAMLLRRIGGEPRQRAREVLLRILQSEDGTLRTEAYFAMRDLGYPKRAEETRRVPPSEER